EWNAALSEGELDDEIASDDAVRSTNLLSEKSGLGEDLPTALTGESGTAFTTSGTVTLDSDEPTFEAAFDGPMLSGSGELPGETEQGEESEVPPGEEVRYNRFLYSNDLTDSVWSKANQTATSNATTPPPG